MIFRKNRLVRKIILRIFKYIFPIIRYKKKLNPIAKRNRKHFFMLEKCIEAENFISALEIKMH